MDFDLKGIAVDAIFFDDPETADYPIHPTLLTKDILLLENLANLDRLPRAHFDFFCMPLQFAAADGATVRAGTIL